MSNRIFKELTVFDTAAHYRVRNKLPAGPGRPRNPEKELQALELKITGFTVPEISKLLCRSPISIKRYIARQGYERPEPCPVSVQHLGNRIG
jgi:hypothetical protein